jgi:hypothetical protein
MQLCACCNLYVCCTCSWSQTLVSEGLAEQFIPLDFAEADTVVDRALQVREGGVDGRAFHCSDQRHCRWAMH